MQAFSDTKPDNTKSVILVDFDAQSSMPMQDIPFLSSDSLTLGKNRRLPAHLTKLSYDLFVSIDKSIERVRDANIGAKLLHELLGSAKIVPWHPWEKVVDGLEL